MEVKLVRSAAHGTLATVPLPHLQFYLGWYQTTTLRTKRRRPGKILVPFHSDQLEFEDCTAAGRLPPEIHQVKDTVVRPYPLTDLLIDPNPLGFTPVGLVV